MDSLVLRPRKLSCALSLQRVSHALVRSQIFLSSIDRVQTKANEPEVKERNMSLVRGGNMRYKPFGKVFGC